MDDARTREATRGMRGARDRREVKEKEFAKELDACGWDRSWAAKATVRFRWVSLGTDRGLRAMT